MLRRLWERAKRALESMGPEEEPEPLAATGALLSAGDGAFLGSCVAYSRADVVLTAAHCIAGRDHSAFTVAYAPWAPSKTRIPVRRLVQHPSADIAVIFLAHPCPRLSPYRDISHALTGEEVHAFGYPEDTTAEGVKPLDRHFKGIAQRAMIYEGDARYSYDAVELSFAAPAGLSGGPLCTGWTNPRFGDTVYALAGIVTGERASSRFLHTVSDVEDGNRRHTESVHGVITYGIALELLPIEGWLSGTISEAAGA